MPQPSLDQAQKSFADYLLHDSASGPSLEPDWIVPSGRLEVYRRAFWSRLLDSLRDDFPRLSEWIGPPLFKSVARDFIRLSQNKGHALYELSRDFPEYIRNHLADHELHEGHADLADWEWAKIESSLMREAPLQKSFKPQDIETAILSLNRSRQMLTLTFNVMDTATPIQKREAPTPFVLWHGPHFHWCEVDQIHRVILEELTSPKSLLDFLESVERHAIDPSALQVSISEFTAKGLLLIHQNKIDVRAHKYTALYN